ncbi:MAG: T9SS type A sorting domain-containing protein [Bacteroidales bacterium]
MKPHFIISILAVFVLPINAVSQNTTNSVTSSAYFIPSQHSDKSKPVFYEPQSPLSENEIHILKALSEQELQDIANETDPPAIGIERKFKTPIFFDLSSTEIPEKGEITVPGGRLTRINADLLVFTTMIKSVNAGEIRICITEGYFPHGTVINLFGSNDQAFSHRNLQGNLPEYGFFTKTIFSDSLVFQVVIPSANFKHPLYFKIPMIIHVEKDFYYRLNNRDCYEDVNCDEAQQYPFIDDLKRSTARLIFFISPYYYVCSGSLLNDLRSNDFQPFLLTASHCINTQAAAASVEARFDYHTITCNGSENPEVILVNGSNLIATNSDTDFSLLLLHKQPSGDRVFLGWDTEAAEDDEILHSVHHPAGSTQKYTRHQNKSEPVNLCSGSPTNKFYYTRTQAGQASGGSSGGLLIKNNGKVAGQLQSTCIGTGYNPCNYSTYYHTWGRFDKSYSDNDLQYWLADEGSAVSISISNQNLDFGEITTGNHDTLTIKITNDGLITQHLNLQISSFDITGTNSFEFSAHPRDELYMPPGESCFIDIAFSPKYAGVKTATLEVFHNADLAPNPLNIPLSGISTGQAITLFLQNINISGGNNICFDAYETILLGGNNSFFVVEDQSIIELIAGQNILIQEGTHFKNGSDILARIDTEGLFCDPDDVKQNFLSEKSFLSLSDTNKPDNSLFNVYPNPTRGTITINTVEKSEDLTVQLEVFDIYGNLVFNSEFKSELQHQANLTNLSPGIYMLKLRSGTSADVKKLVIL